MAKIVDLLRKLERDEDGAALIEYVILFAIIAGATLAAIVGIGGDLKNIFANMGGWLTNNASNFPA